jgi:hypothetical protein
VTLTLAAAILAGISGVSAMMRKFGLLGVTLLLAGCETETAPVGPPPPLATPYASIVGSAQFHTPEGRGLSCSGLAVALVVETPRARQRLATLYGSAEHALAPVAAVRARAAGMPAADPPLTSAQCDAQGGFVFSRVQPGAYYLVAHMHGSAARPSDDAGLLQRIVVQPGEERHIRLAP